jgi:hypothetical protein
MLGLGGYRRYLCAGAMADDHREPIRWKIARFDGDDAVPRRGVGRVTTV